MSKYHGTIGRANSQRRENIRNAEYLVFVPLEIIIRIRCCEKYDSGHPDYESQLCQCNSLKLKFLFLKLTFRRFSSFVLVQRTVILKYLAITQCAKYLAENTENT